MKGVPLSALVGYFKGRFRVKIVLDVLMDLWLEFALLGHD